MNEIPFRAETRRLLKIQSLYKNEPVLTRALGGAQTQNQFAAAYWAVWEWEGVEPHRGSLDQFNGVQRAAIEAVRGVKGQGMTKGGGKPLRPDIFEALTIQRQLVTCYEIDEPSKEARKQRAAYNREQGLTYVGTRVIRKKEVCQTFDQRYPAHWR